MVSAGMASQGMVLPALVLQSRADETGEALADVIPVSLLRPYIQATKYKVIGQTIFMMVLAMGVHTGAIAPDNPMTAPIRPQIDQTIALMEMQRQAQAEAEAVGAAPDQSA
jgi:hypothetical protein